MTRYTVAIVAGLAALSLWAEQPVLAERSAAAPDRESDWTVGTSLRNDASQAKQPDRLLLPNPALLRKMSPPAVPSPEPRKIAAPALAAVGAPGDGETSLAAAMMQALKRHGVSPASATSPGIYKIHGLVGVSAAAEGKQIISIRWLIADPLGNEIASTVLQRNIVPAGSMDRAWGSIAHQVEDAAAIEIVRLIAREEEHRPRKK